MSKSDDFKRSLRAADKKSIDATSMFLTNPRQKANDEPNVKADDSNDKKENVNVSLNPIAEDSVSETAAPNPSASVDVNLAAIPIAQPKRGIRETHTTKAFYIRNDLAELINEDIRKGRRGAMTEIVNALFEQYYRSQGRIK